MPEPIWTQGLPAGDTIEECSHAIDTLEAVLFHYRRRRAGLMSSTRIRDPKNAAAIAAGQKAMRDDPVRGQQWRHNLSHSIRRYRHGIENGNSAAVPQAAAGSGGYPPAAAAPASHGHPTPAGAAPHSEEGWDPDGLA